MTGNGFLDKTQIALEDICLLIVDSEHKTAPLASEGYPYVRTPDIGRGVLNLSDVRRVSHDTYVNWTRKAVPKAGDLVLAREAPIGNVSVVPKNVEICLGQRTVLLRPNPELTVPLYLCYLLLSDSVQHIFHSISSGTTVPHLNLGDIRKLDLSIPPLPIQKKIASVLSTYDDLIENNERRIKILEEMAQSIYREWFVNYRFPGHENIKMVDSELGEIPKGWNPTKLDDLGLLARGKSKFRPRNDPSLFGGPYPFIQTADVKASSTYVTRYEQTYSEAGLAQSALWEAGTLCITIAANIAETAILGIDACFPDSVVGFVPDTQQADVLYVKYCLDTIKLKLQAASRGTTQDNLSLDKLRTFYICLPPMDILSKFNIETRDVIADSLLMVRANQNLRQTRDMLLPKLISGKLDVEELDIAVA